MNIDEREIKLKNQQQNNIMMIAKIMNITY